MTVWWSSFGGAPVLLSGVLAPFCIVVLVWLASLIYSDVSLVDRAWSLCIVSAGVGYVLAMPAPGPRTPWMLGLAGLWALRLSLYITWRSWGHEEDRRYQQIRARNQPRFELKSLVIVFLLQAVLAIVVSAPLLAGPASSRPLGLLDAIGIAIVAFGIVFEAVADAQMAAFKARPDNKGRVMDQGLWRYSRHPNYFGECCVWWGLWLMASAAGGVWSIVSPLLMTWLLLKVSGVTLLEKDLTERRPEYRDYIARTNAFVPGPSRSGQGGS